MFGLMAIGNKAYVEPGPVLGAIIDDAAHQYQIGDERDLREFNEIFLSRITDAYKAVAKINQPNKVVTKEQVMEVDEQNSSFMNPDTPGCEENGGVQNELAEIDEVSALFFGKEIEIKSYQDTAGSPVT